LTTLTGSVLVGAESRTGKGSTFHGIAAADGQKLEPAFHEASAADVRDACELAHAASGPFSELSLQDRARFLETVAASVQELGQPLIERAMAESGLPKGRLEGELLRTVNQLKLFAQVVTEGSWLDVTIDPALPQRTPLPRPDLRRRSVAIGPVAVFGASNFPLAFSVAGGDTASAFAAGCPVVVKGHPAHPGTGEMVANAIRGAVKRCGLHPGTFSYLPGTSHRVGTELVSNPRIMAVGFTGSRAGGLALVAAAAARPEPIPVYAEMSSVNPVILLPGAAKTRGADLANAYVASLTLGAGQFCTNPGLLFALDDPAVDAFVATAAEALRKAQPQVMLTQAIRGSYQKGAAKIESHSNVTTLAQGVEPSSDHTARANLFVVSAKDFSADESLAAEVFGPASLIIRGKSFEELERALESMEGQLTATLLFDQTDEELAARLLPVLERKAGRILGNSWPTGVEVAPAMVHGGPFPATSDSRTTSVGTLAIQRFLRPVCYQNLPESLLPAALRNSNPWGVPRRVDGKRE
jgi:2,5-dioxopentanoate dehydrogenase